ncbi:beta-ketoadipate enol-lactone hydrolase [Pseudohyphozyma bogoriensis]|nr:beta-ketoadipate enol-lactone hydrolase [Pseudohyphozyma bogoriensis]
MPYLDLASGYHLYYVLNPINVTGPSLVSRGDPEPECAPLDKTKPTLVMIHAGFFSSSSFHAQMSDPRLVSSFNLIAVDMPFHGRTSGPDRKEVSMKSQADVLVEVLDMLELESYSLLGEGSHGANVVVWATIMRSEKVEALLLVSPGTFALDPATAHIRDLVCGNKDGKGDGSGRLTEEGLNMMKEYFFGPEGRQDDRRTQWGKAVEGRYGAGKSSSDVHNIMHFLIHRAPIPQEMRAAITAPVLILQGEDDWHASPVEASEEWRDGFASAKDGADLRRLVGAPHCLMYTDFSVANRFVKAFIERHRDVKKH